MLDKGTVVTEVEVEGPRKNLGSLRAWWCLSRPFIISDVLLQNL